MIKITHYLMRVYRFTRNLIALLIYTSFYRQLQAASLLTRNTDPIPEASEKKIKEIFEKACVDYEKLDTIEFTTAGGMPYLNTPLHILGLLIVKLHY